MRIDFTPIMQYTWVASGIAVGTGAVKLIGSLEAHHKDQQQLNALKQPFAKVQDEFFQNRNLAGQMAGQGLPSSELQYLTQGAERGLGTGVNALLRGGGDVNDVAGLLEGYNNQLGKIGAEDAETHMNNIRYFMDTNAKLAEEKEKTWAINEYQPYEAKLKQLQQSVATDKQNEWNSFDSIASGAMSGIQGNQYAKLLKQLYGQPKPDPIQEPYATYTPQRAATTTQGANSPAADVSTINPNSYSSGAVVNPWDHM